MNQNSRFLVLSFIVLGLIYWQFWLPGIKAANDFPFISEDHLKKMLDIPRVWSDRGGEGFGQDTIVTLWSYPISLLSGVVSNIGISFALIEKVLYFLPFLIIGVFSIWNFLGFLKITSSVKFIGSIFYLANTYILLLIDGGQLQIALAYALFPLAFMLFEKAVFGNLRSKIISGFAVTMLGFFDIRFVYIFALLLFFRYVFLLIFQEKRINYTYLWAKTGLVVLSVFVILHTYWLIPLFFTESNPNIYKSLTQTSFLNFTTLGHAFLFLSPHWHRNIFGEITPLLPVFFIIPIFVFLAPVLRRKDEKVGFWLLVAILSVFLAKGFDEPLSFIYKWLFQNIPGFSLFRDSTKFFFLVALSYTALICFSLEVLFKYLKSRTRKILAILFTLGLILFLIKPVFLNQMNGILSFPKPNQDFSSISETLSQDKSFGRVLWIPSLPAQGFSDPAHPRLDAARIISQRPFTQGIRGTYELFNFIREAPYMGELFNIFGIKYIIYPGLDSAREILNADKIRYYGIFSNQIGSLPWVQRTENIEVFKTYQNENKFFSSANRWWVIGSDEIYAESTKSAKLTLSNNALVFLEEGDVESNILGKLVTGKVVLFKKTLNDLAAFFIEKNRIIFPSKSLGFSPDVLGWWKRDSSDLINWRYFLKTKYSIDNQDFGLGEGWAVAEGERQLIIRNSHLKSENILLARVMESSQSGEINFFQGNVSIGKLETKRNETNVRWFEIGKLSSSNELIIKTHGNINVINALAILPAKEWGDLKKRAQSFKEQGLVSDFDERSIEDNRVIVTYKEINPTKYIVDVGNIKNPLTLVFSQTYDKNWKLNGQESFPVYSILNGFTIERDGEYIVEYAKQRIINYSIPISLFSLILFTSICLWNRKKD